LEGIKLAENRVAKGFAINPMVRYVPLCRITPSTEKEFGDALKREDDSIEIIGDLAKKTIRLRATGNVAWTVLSHYSSCHHN
jgi:hypothetical protein